jgi:hypothetical protein
MGHRNQGMGIPRMSSIPSRKPMLRFSSTLSRIWEFLLHQDPAHGSSTICIIKKETEIMAQSAGCHQR